MFDLACLFFAQCFFADVFFGIVGLGGDVGVWCSCLGR